MNLHVGDRITKRRDALEQVIEIVEVRPSGYAWRYVPRIGHIGLAEAYSSESTDDPFFDRGWSLLAVLPHPANQRRSSSALRGSSLRTL
jgi:hypothetical protein